MVRLGDGTDSFGTVSGLSGGHGAWPQLGGWVEQRAAQVLELAQSGGGHGEAAPAAGGAVEDGSDQGEAAGLAGEPAMTLTRRRVSPKVRSVFSCPIHPRPPPTPPLRRRTCCPPS